MFNKNKAEEIQSLKKENESLKKCNEQLQRDHEKLNSKLETEKEKYDLLKNETGAKIASAVKENNLDLQIEKNNLKARADILEKAFENMGFDVKDMKDILNKLVDGLIAKNEINIIK